MPRGYGTVIIQPPPVQISTKPTAAEQHKPPLTNVEPRRKRETQRPSCVPCGVGTSEYNAVRHNQASLPLSGRRILWRELAEAEAAALHSTWYSRGQQAGRGSRRCCRRRRLRRCRWGRVAETRGRSDCPRCPDCLLSCRHCLRCLDCLPSRLRCRLRCRPLCSLRCMLRCRLAGLRLHVPLGTSVAPIAAAGRPTGQVWV